MPDTIWLTPFLRVVRPEDGSVLRYSPEAVQDVLDFFSLLCFGQNEWAGKPFVLLPWEEQAIRQFYGVQVRDEDGTWVRYRRFLYDEIPKKNGKSEFAAGLGLYHLLFDGEERPQVGVFAADKNNADIIYQCAKYMVEHTCLGQPEGDPIAWARDSRREIHTKYGGVLKVYSSDADSKHGYSFSAILIDELHAQPNRRLWDVLTVGSDAARRQQAVIVLTTAGDDPDRIVELDIFDEALWRECNPSYGVTISPRKFRSDARAARQSEAAERNFRWLRLNQWIATKDVGWMPLTLYDKTQWTRPEWRPLSAPARRQAARDVLEGKTCYGGLDLSTTTDLTALTLIFPPQEGLDTWTTLFWAWRPEDGVLEAEQRDHVPYRDWGRAGFLELCPGDMVDFTMVEDTAAWCVEHFHLDTLGVDPYLSRTLTQRLMERGVNVVEIPQTMMSMSPAMKELERLIRARQMLHEHNTCARFCFGNVRCAVDGNENRKPMKNRSIGRIDMAVAGMCLVAYAVMVARARGGGGV